MAKNSRWRSITVDVDIDCFEVLPDVDDDSLVAELESRGFSVVKLSGNDEQVTMRDRAISIQSLLLVGRHAKAEQEVTALVEAIVPPHILDVMVAIKDRRYGDAICSLDRAIDPSPAATATVLPTAKRLDG